MSKSIPITECTLVFLRRDDEILLAMKKRGFGTGKWNGPGGKCEPNETIDQTMVRECEEEVGAVPIKYEMVAEGNFRNSKVDEPWQLHIHVYVCDEWRGEIVESEEMAPKWFKIDDIPYDEMWDDDKYWLPRVLNGEKIVSFFEFDANDKVLSYTINPATELTVSSI